MNKQELAYKLHNTFLNQAVISTKEIAGVLAQTFPGLSSKTISWRINQLKKEKLIFQVGRGLYSFEFKPEYEPELSLKAKRLFNRINNIKDTEIVIWDINLIDEFSESHSGKKWYFLYVKKDKLERTFNDLQDNSKPAFLQPDNEVISRYLLGQDEAIILLPKISEMPLIKAGEYTMPSLEGLLVNFWLKSENFLRPIGYDVHQIFVAAFEKYNVNISKLLRFAARRDKRNEINELIKSII